MKKILLIIYYDLVEYLESIKNNFQKYHFEISFYPLFKYAYDVNHKLDNYAEHLDNFIGEKKPDIILWWFIDVNIAVFKKIIEKYSNIYFIIYNSDDPINLSNDIFQKCSLFNLILTPCDESRHLYKLFCKKDTLFLPFGYDENVFFPLSEKYIVSNKEKYQSDISIYSSNLFLDKNLYPDQQFYFINFLSSLSQYAKNKNIILKLYGSHILNEYFPEYYAGDPLLEKLNLIFNLSKINIVTHPSIKMSLPLNKNLFSILGAGGLLLVDNFKNLSKILLDGKNCIVIDDNYIDKIDHILNNYQTYQHIRKNTIDVSQNYTWTEWVKKIIYHYSITFFDSEFYATMYGLPKNDNLLEYWKENGWKKMEICYNFNIPNTFLDKLYYDDFAKKVENNSKQYLYYHWYVNSQNMKYMSKNIVENNKIFKFDEDGLTVDEYYYIFTIFQKIKNNIDRDENLLLLCKIFDGMYNVNSNLVLDKYIQSIL